MDSVASATAAVRAGADRLELCVALDVGGTTPAMSLVSEVVEHSTVPVFVMVRPRGGQFVFDPAELRTMRESIRAFASLGASGIVTGALRIDGSIDEEAVRSLAEEAGTLPVTLHRAFDETPDLARSLETVRALGVRRILTSGGAATASEGMEGIAHLVRLAGPSVVVMAGGKVRAWNAREIAMSTGVRELHARTTEMSDAEVRALAAAVHGTNASHPR